MNAPLRITPAATPLRRDQALAFIIDRIVRTSICPTLDEISQALGVSKPRVRELIDQLVDAGLIERTVGTQRNLRVRDVAHCRSMLEVSLRRLGWATVGAAGSLEPPLPKVQLPMLAPFEHIPDID
jgi:DNA-binding GntR family transcriptional regulator